jgi:FAD/FMN-containing dehydrogenase
MSRMFDAYEAAPVPSVLFGHLGDNHLHLNLLPRSVDEVAVARAFHHALAAAAIAAGGTLSAEHGIGRVKKAWFEEFAPPGLLESSRSLKRRLDPGWILSRGVMFDAAPPRSGDEVPAGVRSGASGG